MAGQTLQTNIVINARTGNGFSQVGATLTELGSLVDGISRKLIDFGGDSIRVYRDYEKSMTSAEVALSTTYGRGTQELGRVMAQLDAQATEWAATTIFHTNDVGNAISEAAHAGWDLDQIMAGIPAAMQLAQAGGLDLSEAVNYIVKSTTAAGIGFEDMSHWIDLWAFAANSSATDIGEFGEAMLKMGSTMRFAANPEELMTLIAVTANAGAVGSEAGTMIRNSMIRLIAPTDKAREAMDELGATSEEYAEVLGDEKLLAANERLSEVGFSAYDENGQLKSIIDTYRDLYVALGEVAGGYEGIEENEDALRILTAIFPTRNTTEALNLLRAVSDGSMELYDAMRGGAAEGYGTYGAETMMDTLDGKIETFLSKVERLKQLTGGELSGQLEALLRAGGNFIDKISEMDEGSFSMFVRGMEGIAFTGPALLGLGAASRFIGLLTSSPLAAAAVGITAVAASLGVLSAYSDLRFESNFGDMALDLTALKQRVDVLTTDAEQRLSGVREYTEQVAELATQYKESVSAFQTDLASAVLSGKELTPVEKAQLIKYGQSITDTVIKGITTRREGDLTLLNAITPDEMTGEEGAVYSGLYDSLFGYFGDLETEASQIGTRLQQAMTEALTDGIVDEQERAIIQQYVDDLNRIEAEITAQMAKGDYYSELEKAGRVSKESMDEYLEYLAQNNKERTEEVGGLYDALIGDARAAYEKEIGHEISDEAWEQTDRYQDLSSRRDSALNEINEQTAAIARRAFEAILNDSDLVDSYNLAERLATQTPRREDGSIDTQAIDWSQYAGEIPENFLRDMRDLDRLLSSFGEWTDIPGMEEIFALVRDGMDGLGASYAGWQAEEAQRNPVSTQAEAQVAMPGASGADTITELREQGVQVNVQGEFQEMDAQLEARDAMTLLEYVDGDAENLSMVISDQDGRLLTEIVDGDVDALRSAINRFDGQVIHVNIRANNMLPTGLGLPLYAEGGRATSASIFGEAGPEWAIPEAHDENTAQLLAAAAEASGFSWPEIAARGSGGGGGNSTLVYAPVIYAGDAAGVDEALLRDKERFEQWMRERDERERAEVYK